MAKAKHVLFIPGALWGHLRSSLAIICSLLPIHPNLHITLFLPAEFSEMTQTEIGHYQLEPGARDRLRIIRYGREGGDPFPKFNEIEGRMEPAVQNIKENLPRIIKGEAIKDSISGEMIPTFEPRVSTVYGDYLWITHLPHVIAEIAPDIKQICLISLGVQTLDWYMMDLVDKPGIRDVMEDVEGGMSGHDAWIKDLEENDRIVRIPGCEAMYTYETTGLPGSSFQPWMEVYNTGRKNFRTVIKGVLAYYPPYLARRTVAKWSYPEIPLYCVGPLLPPSEAIQGVEDETSRWLDKALKQYGEKSVAYVSFGSLFFPPSAKQVPILVSALAERGKPALFVSGNCTSEIKALLEEAVKNNGKGLVKTVEWAAQQAVMNHPAVGWCLTHAGEGASIESISAGLPMVMWPVFGDQVFLANQFSRVERIGLEMIQIRGGGSIGKKTFRGPTVMGTEGVIAKEMEDVFRLSGDFDESGTC